MLAKADEVLFAVNATGRVCYLSSGSSSTSSSNEITKWLELPYVGLDFKRVSCATPSGSSTSRTPTASANNGGTSSGSGGRLWAIGGDHQIYVLVFGVEVPIRVREVCYENQRWNPIDGFCKNLLPTDRPQFSNAEGTQKRNKDAIKLPTLAWSWDSEWYVDTNFNGKALDKDVRPF